MDLASEKPRVLSLLGSTSDTMCIDKPGDEPDMMSTTFPERKFLNQDDSQSSVERRKQANVGQSNDSITVSVLHQHYLHI